MTGRLIRQLSSKIFIQMDIYIYIYIHTHTHTHTHTQTYVLAGEQTNSPILHKGSIGSAAESSLTEYCLIFLRCPPPRVCSNSTVGRVLSCTDFAQIWSTVVIFNTFKSILAANFLARWLDFKDDISGLDLNMAINLALLKRISRIAAPGWRCCQSHDRRAGRLLPSKA